MSDENPVAEKSLGYNPFLIQPREKNLLGNNVIEKVKTERFDPLGRSSKSRKTDNRLQNHVRAISDPSFKKCQDLPRPEIHCDDGVCPKGFPMWDCTFPDRKVKEWVLMFNF